MSLCIDDRLVHRFGWNAVPHIPDAVFIQLILLMMDT